MCNISITNVTAVPNGTGSDLTITGTASLCDQLLIEVDCRGDGTLDSDTVQPDNSGNWTINISVPCPCNVPVTITASCPGLPNCQDTFTGIIPCPPTSCCENFLLSYVAGPCNPDGTRTVTFTISGNISQATCLNYTFAIDYGDGGFSFPQIVTSTGPFTLTDTHNYIAGNAPFNAVLQYAHSNGPFNTCPPTPVLVDMEPCPPTNCCPMASTNVVFGPCDVDCDRLVTLQSAITLPSGCSPAVMEWKLFDSSNSPITTGAAFVVTGSLSHTESFYLSPNISPVTARLVTILPTGCPDVIETITIPPCQRAPSCPSINSFTSQVLGCRPLGNDCCTKVEFTLDADFDSGCGNQPLPEITLHFGDGNNETRTIPYGGLQQLVFDHEYCTPGNYTATLEIDFPTGCPDRSIQVIVPPCTLAPPVCPTISIDDIRFGPCKDECKREVELDLKLQNPDPCATPGTFHIDWGDSDRHPNSGSMPVPNSQTVSTYSHVYGPGTYTITVTVDSPTGCPTITRQITIPDCPDCGPPCQEDKRWKRILCPILKFLADIGKFAAVLGLLLMLLPICFSVNTIPVGAAIFGVALVFILLYAIICKCKPCGWLWDTLFSIFFPVGLLLLIFSGCCTNFTWLGLGMVLTGLVFLWLWVRQCCQQANKLCCYFERILSVALPMVTAYAYVVTNFPAIANCEWIIFSSPFFTLSFMFLLLLALNFMQSYRNNNC